MQMTIENFTSSLNRPSMISYVATGSNIASHGDVTHNRNANAKSLFFPIKTLGREL
jgi:hypothetical protein